MYIKRKAHNKIPSVDAPAVVIQKKSKSGGSKASLLNGLLTVPDGHQDFDIDDSGETLFDGPDSKFLFDALQPTHELATKGLNHNSHAAVAAYSHPSNSNSSGLGGQSGRLGNSLDPATMLEELVHQQAMQDSFEHRLRELEHQSGCVTSENAMLKRVVSEIGGRQAETQQRVDGLLKFIYSVFITNSDSLPNSIAQSAVCIRFIIACFFRIELHLILLFFRKRSLKTRRSYYNIQVSHCRL